MSARATFWAWEQDVPSVHFRCILLCLADCHNADNGQCNPSIAHISRKTKCDRKTVMKALKTLEQHNFISVVKGVGSANNYVFNFETSTSDGTTTSTTQGSTNDGTTNNGQSHQWYRGSTTDGTWVVPPVGHESKKNLKENLKEGNQEEKQPQIPFSKIQQTWNEILGDELGNLRSITDQRKKSIKARISESPALAEVEKWTEYFEYILSIDFLMGRGQVNPNTGKPFKANFDWVINQANMNKILEGRYE